jgi:septum formation topological specificity factor MinE
MTSFQEQHFYVIVKEKLGIILAECVRHTPPDYIIGVRNGEYIDVVERFIDKQQAEKVYNKMVLDKQSNSSKEF